MEEIVDLENRNETTKSEYVLDEMVNSHPRTQAATRAFRELKGDKIETKIPSYLDKNQDQANKDKVKKPGEIHMDTLIFGAGCC